MPDALVIDCQTGRAQARPLTAAEQQRQAADAAAVETLDATVATQEGNARTLRERLTAGLDANKTYMALGSPSAAQNTAQIRQLTRENNALIRLALRALDATD